MDKRIEIGKRIKQRREELCMTQKELGEALWLNKSTIQRYENGIITKIKIPVLHAMAKQLNVDPRWLALKTDNMGTYSESYELYNDEVEKSISEEIKKYSNNVFMCPLYDSVAAGFNALAQNTIVGYIPTQIMSPSEQEKYIWVNVVGDSMSPMIDDGSKVLIKLQESVDSGQIAIILIDDEEAVVKRVVYGDNWIELQSVNPYYPPRRFEGQDVRRVRVMGLVKEVSKSIN